MRVLGHLALFKTLQQMRKVSSIKYEGLEGVEAIRTY